MKNSWSAFLPPRLLLLLWLGASLAAGCADEDRYSPSDAIYSQNTEVEFREIILIVKPYLEIEDQRHYILVPQIKALSISINEKPWGSFDSFLLDTSGRHSEPVLGFATTTEEVKYAFSASYQTDNDTLLTAGDFAELLVNMQVLQPGFHICMVDSFLLSQNNGSVATAKPYILELLEVTQGQTSAFLGEFEVKITP